MCSAEQETYNGDGGNFERDEVYYRQGFEAAQSPEARGKTYEEAHDYLTRKCPIGAGNPQFVLTVPAASSSRNGLDKSPDLGKLYLIAVHDPHASVEEGKCINVG